MQKIYIRILIVPILFFLSVFTSEANAQTPFVCDSTTYLEQGQPGDPTTLYKISTNSNPFVFSPIGTSSVTYNAVGYNPLDNYQYGILNASNRLIRIAADGSTVNLGAVTGLPSATYISGTFSDTGGLLYVKNNVGTSTAMYVVNVSTMTASLLSLTFPAGLTNLAIADMAWVNGLLYSVTSAGQLVSINPTTGIVTAIGAPNGLPAGFIGAMYGAPNGLFGSGNNPPSGFYQFNLTTGAATLISGAPGSSSNDGSNCASQNIVFGADLSITKTDNQTQYIAGSNITYQLLVKNAGPFGAQSVTVADPLPSGITSATWTCGGATGGAVCGASNGSGALNDANASLPNGSSLTYTMTLAVPSGFTGNLTNVATVTPGPATSNIGTACTAAGSSFNAATGRCTASDTDTRTLPIISITKSTNIGGGTLVPNAAVTYFVDVSNTGVALADGTAISDSIPSGIASFNSWSCAPTSGSAVISPSAGSGALSTTISSFPVGAVVRCTINATVAASPPATVVNSATASPNNGGLCAPGNTPSPCSASVSNPTAPQLNITKTASPNGTYLPGQPLNYTITVTNVGAVTASGVGVTDTVPTLVTVSGWNCVASGGGNCGSVVSGTGNAITLSGASIPAGGSITIAVSGTAQISATGNIVNTATVACGYASCNKSSTVTNTDSGKPLLSVAKQATPTAFAVGASGTYTLQVSNSNAPGSSSTTGVITVSDPLPVGITMTGLPMGTGWDCSASTATQVTCTTSAVLTPGASAPVISVPVAIAQSAANPSVNTATVTGGGDAICTASANPVPAQCQGTTTTTVNAPQLDLVKTSGGAFTVGQIATYTIVVTNNGQAATSVAATVSDTIPTGLVIGTPLPNGCTASGQTVSCTIPAGLAVGAQASFTVSVTPNSSVNGQQVSNTASVQGGGDPTCPGAAHCTGTTTNTVSAPQLGLTKTSTPSAFVVGQVGSYTLTVLNSGTAPTTGNTVVSDTIPAGLTIGTLPSGCTATGQQLSCTIAAGLAVNASVNFTIPVTATAAVDGQTVQNAATVAGGGDPGCTAATNPLPARCQAQVSVPVESPALHVTKTASIASFSVGVAASYTIQVTNVGTADTSGNWSVTDVVPGGLTIGTLPSGCTASGQQVTCSSSAVIAAGDTTGVSFVIPVTPTAAAVPSVTNTATVQGGGDPHCPMASNANCTSTITTSVNAPSLTVTKAAAPGTFVVGQQASYTLTVGNNGQAATIGVVTVLDTLPVGITLVADPTNSNGWTCTASGATVSCTSSAVLNLAVGATSQITLAVNVAEAAAPSAVNHASVGGGGDPFNGGTPLAPNTCTDTAAAPNHCVELTTPVTPVADMQATAPSTVATTVGVPASVTTTCTNNGPNVAVSATCIVTGVPPATNPVTTCTPTSPVASLAVSATISCTTTFTPIDTTPITITTTAGSATQDPIPGNNAAITTTTAGNAVNLSIAKTATPSGTYQPNGALNYQIVVTNNGPSPAAGATVNDIVPSAVTVTGWTCVASAGGVCTASGAGNTIIDTVSIPVGGTVTYTINGTVTNNAAGDIVNTATATPPAGSSCTTPPCQASSTTTNTNTGSPLLSVAKQATPTAFAVGASGTYTLQVSNSNAPGSSSTTGVITVSDPLPVGITMTGLPMGTGWDCSASTATQVTCTTSAVLTPGASAPVISVPVAIAQSAANPSVNTATVTGGGDAICTASANPVPAQCQGTTTTTVNAPQLDLVKTSGGAFTVGQIATYTIVVTNNGQAATSVAATVSDTIPTGLVIGTPLPNGCTASGQTVSCTIPAGLAVGAQASFTVSVTPNSSVNGQQVSNTASVQGGGDPTCPGAAHCTGTTTNTVSAPQLGLTKTSTPSAFVVGQVGSYTLTVLNSGTAPTTGNTVVSDTIPAGLTIGTLPSGCTATGQQLSCTIAAGLAVNASVNFTIPVTATAAVDGQTVQNAATVAGGGDPGCTAATNPLPARCQAQVSVPVESPALHVTKTASIASFSVGVAASYTIQVTNVGTADTSGNWSVTDVVPGGLTIGTLPSGCTASGQQVTCSSSAVIAAGDTTGVSFVIPVTPTAAAVPSVTNTATVQGGGDPHCPMASNANCTSTITTSVNAPSLQLTKTSNGPWVVGQSGAAYTLAVTNASTQTATSGQITVVDSLPMGISAVGGTYGNWTCSVSGQSVTCQSAIALPANGSDSIVLPVTVDASAIVSGTGSSVTNNASVGGGGDPFNGGNPPAPGSSCTALDAATPGHCATNITTVNIPAAMAVSKGVPTITATATPGQYTASYVVTVTNGGGVPSTYTLSDTPGYPAGIVLNSWTVTASNGGVVNTPLAMPANGVATQISAANVAIAAGGSHAYNVTITFTTSSSLSTSELTCTGNAGSGAYNTASINAGTSTSANCGPLPGAPSLSLAKTNNGPWLVAQAGAKYTLVVTNSGNAATAGIITIRDVMPVGITTASGTYGNWSCTAAGQSLDCTSAVAINPGGQSAIDLPVNIASTAISSSVTNMAGVGGGGDPFNGGNPPDPQNCNDAQHCAISTTTVTTNVTPQPNLVVTKTNNATSVPFGGVTTYTITIVNSGLSSATGVSWTDTVVSGLSEVLIVSKAGDDKGSDPGTCSGLTCTGITVAAGGTVSYVVSAKVTGKVGEQVANTASVIGGQCTAQASGGSCASTDSDAVVGANVSPVPVNSRSLLLMMGLLVLFAVARNLSLSIKQKASRTRN
ncbi:DUF6923 family protein [Comamonas sp. 4034]|uniref:beta strand repeat-containing protein n=1 Tax=Comamonas sp. 4034 TaxID=3156455 RepID=UPI003D219C63